MNVFFEVKVNHLSLSSNFLFSIFYHSEFLYVAVGDAINSPFNNNIREPGTNVKILAETIVKSQESEFFFEYAENLLKNILDIFTENNILKKENNSFNKLFNFICKKLEQQKFKNFLERIECPDEKGVSMMLFNQIVNSILRQTIAFHSSLVNEPDDVITNFDITKDEQETLYYIAGYIVFSLKKSTKFDRDLLIPLFDTWGVKGETDFKELGVDDYIRAWLDQINRGGLFQVNKEFFNLIFKLELLARTIININLISTYCGENIKEVLKKKFLQNATVKDIWKKLSGNISSHESLRAKLLEKIVIKWIHVRAWDFVRTWMQQYKWRLSKKGETVSEQAEPALRKGLIKSKTKHGKKVVDRSLLTPNKSKGTPLKQSRTVAVASSKVKKSKKILAVKKLKL